MMTDARMADLSPMLAEVASDVRDVAELAPAPGEGTVVKEYSDALLRRGRDAAKEVVERAVRQRRYDDLSSLGRYAHKFDAPKLREDLRDEVFVPQLLGSSLALADPRRRMELYARFVDGNPAAPLALLELIRDMTRKHITASDLASMAREHAIVVVLSRVRDKDGTHDGVGGTLLMNWRRLRAATQGTRDFINTLAFFDPDVAEARGAGYQNRRRRPIDKDEAKAILAARRPVYKGGKFSAMHLGHSVELKAVRKNWRELFVEHMEDDYAQQVVDDGPCADSGLEKLCMDAAGVSSDVMKPCAVHLVLDETGAVLFGDAADADADESFGDVGCVWDPIND